MEQTKCCSFTFSLSFLSGLHCVMLRSETTSWFTNTIICFPFLSSPNHNAGTVLQVPTLLRGLKRMYHVALALM